MHKNEIAEHLESYIKKKHDVDDDDGDFDNNVNLFDYGYVDSFGAADLIAHIDSFFNVAITDTDLITKSMNTINEIASVIEAKLSNN